MRKKRIINVVLAISMIVSLLTDIHPTIVSAADEENQVAFSGDFLAPIEEPDASAEKIYTVADLMNMNNNLQGSYVLMRDIDLSNSGNWTPIGKTKSTPFCGKLDGQGHKITGLNINVSINSASLNSPSHAVGLFGVCKGAMIKNLEFDNVNIKIENSSGYEYVNSKIDGTNIYAGGIGGYLYGNTSVYNCHVSGDIEAATSQEAHNAYAGGISGYMESTIVSYSENHAEINASASNSISSADAYAGGVAGASLVYGYIDHFSNAGTITATTKDYGNAYGGGFLGIGSGDVERFEISDSYNEGTVKSIAGNMFCDSSYAGGIAGKYLNTINRVYNSGDIQAKATSYIEGTAYAGGICATSTSDTVIKNSASIQKSITALGTTNSYKYYISQGDATKENNIALSTLSGGTNDATDSKSESELKEKGVYENQLLWDFNTVWQMVSGKEYPQIKSVETESEEYQREYIQQHKAFINEKEYSDILENYRWAKIYWSEENNFKSNAAGELYNGIDTTVKVLSLNFAELFDDGNPYKIILADYVSDQVVEEEVMKMYKAELPLKMDKIFIELKKFVKKHWKNSYGELNDKDLFYLFHFDENTSEKWINEDFQNHLEEIVYETKNSGSGFEKVIGTTSEAFDEIIKLKDNYNSFASFINNLLQYSANVDAYCTASESFKQILKKMEDNIGESSAEHKVLLKSALSSYTMYNDKENTTGNMILQYAKEQCIANITSKLKDAFHTTVNHWIKSVLSEKAMSKLNKIGWAANVSWKIAEYLTKNGDLQNCRDMLRANASLESVMYDTLREIEKEFLSNATYDNAYMFDAAFRFFKETQIYSMDICMEYLNIYQTSWVAAIKNVSRTSKVSAIEEVIYNKLFLYKTYCHGTSYDMGMKLVKVACPTNVYVYDNKNIEIASVVNEEVSTEATDIVVFVSGKEKWFALPTGRGYSIKIVATDDGEMEYSVTEYDDKFQRIGVNIYPDIALSKNQIFKGNISSGYNTSDASVYQLNDNFGNEYTNARVITPDNYIGVSELSVSSSKIDIQVDDLYTVDAVIYPKNASYQNLTWYSSDEKVATVSENGTIKGISKGVCEIIVCSIDENIAKILEVNVSGKFSPTSPVPSPDNSATPSVSPSAFPTAVPTVKPSPSITPIVKPDDISKTDSKIPSSNKDSLNQTAKKSFKLVKNAVFKDEKSGATYKIKSLGKNAMVEYVSSDKFVACVKIPTIVKCAGKKFKVISIASKAFYRNRKLKKVTLGKNIKKIGKKAFYGCGKLKTIKLDSNLITIGNSAFEKCSALTKLTLPPNLKKVGNKAFYHCKKLKYVMVKTKKLKKGRFGNNVFGKGYRKPRVKTAKKVWRVYSGMFIIKGKMSKKAIFVVHPVKLVN